MAVMKDMLTRNAVSFRILKWRRDSRVQQIWFAGVLVASCEGGLPRANSAGMRRGCDVRLPRVRESPVPRSRLAVLDAADRLVGIISKTDLVRAVQVKMIGMTYPNRRGISQVGTQGSRSFQT